MTEQIIKKNKMLRLLEAKITQVFAVGFYKMNGDYSQHLACMKRSPADAEKIQQRIDEAGTSKGMKYNPFRKRVFNIWDDVKKSYISIKFDLMVVMEIDDIRYIIDHTP